MKIDYVVLQVHLPIENTEVRTTKCCTLVYQHGRWLRNDEVDGGEFVEMPPPPKEVTDYFDSLIQ